VSDKFPVHDLAHVSEWVFDLDNTLYPAACDLFAQIDVRMTEFVANYLNLSDEEAHALQKFYYAEHGTTLNGLMLNNGLEPTEFLDYVHDIDLTPVLHSEELAAAITALPGRKIVYTNGSRGHAERVTKKLGLEGLFDGMFGIEDSGFKPKPQQDSFDSFIAAHMVEPKRAAFFEDLARNLVPAFNMGFTTILVRSDHDWSHEPEAIRPAGNGDDQPAFVDYVTDDLTAFLSGVAKDLSETR